MNSKVVKAAFSVWNGRIAPVFDVSERIVLLDIADGRVIRHRSRMLAGSHPEEKARSLIEIGAAVLVCGAISAVLQNRLEAGGVRVIPFVAGNADDIVSAWRGGALKGNAFAMPGCGRRRIHGCGWGRGGRQEVENMNGQGQGRGGGRGQGRGMGRGGAGIGRGGGPQAAGPIGECVCPQCGHVEPHQRGLRCFDRACPKCGSMMARK
jgi:predicted Fe-Mo cluster-binding NifX family protein